MELKEASGGVVGSELIVKLYSQQCDTNPSELALLLTFRIWEEPRSSTKNWVNQGNAGGSTLGT